MDKVNFGMVMNLLDEAETNGYPMSITDLIAVLEMNEVPMTDNVRKLGIAAGILSEQPRGYFFMFLLNKFARRIF